MHQLLAHNPAFDPLFFTTQFLDGLKNDIRIGVALHRPHDLDSAFSLSLLQEELMGLMPRKDQGQARHPARPLLAVGRLHPRPVPPAPQQRQKIAGPWTRLGQPTGALNQREARTASPRCAITVAHAVSASSAENDGGKAISALPPFNSMWWKNCWKCYRPKRRTGKGMNQTLMRSNSCPSPRWRPQGHQTRGLCDCWA